jgi:hypothetical protein
MGSPAEFRRCGSFLAESLDTPGIDELVHFLGLVGDLSVSLAAMDDLNSQFMGEVIEALGARMRGDSLGRLAREFFSSRQRAAISSSACLVKWLIRPGLAPCSRTAVGPGSDQAAFMRRRFICLQ